MCKRMLKFEKVRLKEVGFSLCVKSVVSILAKDGTFKGLSGASGTLCICAFYSTLFSFIRFIWILLALHIYPRHANSF